ncbi:MAG: nitroreductase [Bacteroidota bacterium]|nr:nitroreductase [Bacteroidota bacterium]MDP4216577.1 nitroreductase [Bacteroidota bacterium]MDP4245041.1 nitroreductase [Bacteroidota bacterium]MDP4254759.1 nitroreductase [Bacteroidota bacterium]MDP4259868.1 nitroreductase [Bacteroidota bacterium]
MERTLLAPVEKTETEKIIYSRRAVRRYKNKPVDRQVVEEVLEAGRMAPSAMNRQPWQFYVLTNKETIKAFSKEIAGVAMKGALRSGVSGIAQMLKAASGLLHLSRGVDLHAIKDPVFYGAPVVIFLTARRDNEWASLDIGMCAQNIMLAAKSLGLDTCPVGFGKFVEKTKIFPRLHVPASEEVKLAIILGYGDESPEVHERTRDNLLFID